MTHSAGYMTPIDGERWSVHAPDGRQLARHGCAAAAQLHLVDLALAAPPVPNGAPWSAERPSRRAGRHLVVSLGNLREAGCCSGYGPAPICEICEQPVLDPTDPMDYGVCRACWREHDDDTLSEEV